VVDRGKVLNDGMHFGGVVSPPERIAKLGADVVISYGMGNGALSSFKEKNIKVLEALSPSPIQNIAVYVKGELKEFTNVCSLHHKRAQADSIIMSFWANDTLFSQPPPPSPSTPSSRPLRKP